MLWGYILRCPIFPLFAFRGSGLDNIFQCCWYSKEGGTVTIMFHPFWLDFPTENFSSVLKFFVSGKTKTPKRYCAILTYFAHKNRWKSQFCIFRGSGLDNIFQCCWNSKEGGTVTFMFHPFWLNFPTENFSSVLIFFVGGKTKTSKSYCTILTYFARKNRWKSQFCIVQSKVLIMSCCYLHGC